MNPKELLCPFCAKDLGEDAEVMEIYQATKICMTLCIPCFKYIFVDDLKLQVENNRASSGDDDDEDDGYSELEIKKKRARDKAAKYREKIEKMLSIGVHQGMMFLKKDQV